MSSQCQHSMESFCYIDTDPDIIYFIELFYPLTLC